MTTETKTETAPEHFRGCHPEDAQAPDGPISDAAQAGQAEPCWHCGTDTPLGCSCPECRQDEDVVPAGAMYHCPTCQRWWAYMTFRSIEFPGI